MTARCVRKMQAHVPGRASRSLQGLLVLMLLHLDADAPLTCIDFSCLVPADHVEPLKVFARPHDTTDQIPLHIRILVRHDVADQRCQGCRRKLWTSGSSITAEVSSGGLMCRAQAATCMPTVGLSTDRRALQQLHEVLRDDNVDTLICLFCAERHLRVGGLTTYKRLRRLQAA